MNRALGIAAAALLLATGLAAADEPQYGEQPGTATTGSDGRSPAEPECVEEQREYESGDPAVANGSTSGSYDYHYEYEKRCSGQWDGPPAECRGQFAAQEEQARDISLRQQGERDALAQQWDERWAAFQASNHSEEEASRLQAEQEAEWRAMDERHRAEWEQLSRSNEASPCVAGSPPPPAVCAVEWRHEASVQMDEKMRTEMEQFHRLMEERRATFEAQMRAESEAFQQSNHSKEEAQAFHAALEERGRAFQQQMEQDAVSFKQRGEAHFRQFAENHGQRCAFGEERAAKEMPLPAAPAAVRRHYSAYNEWDERRLQFELELRVAYAEFLEEQAQALRDFEASDPSPADRRAFEARQDAERLRFELGMRQKMRAFESSVREEWKAEVGAEIEGKHGKERMGSFELVFDEEAQRGYVTGTYVAFEGDPSTQSIGPYTVQGRLVLDALRASEYLEDFQFGEGREGSHLAIAGNHLRMALHDHPSGLMKLQAKDPASIELDFADYLELEPEANGYRITDGEGFHAFLRVGGEHELGDGNLVSLVGEATFLVKNHEAAVLDKVANKHRAEVVEAIEQGAVGAEVTLVEDDGALAEETLEYGEVTVQVEESDAADGTASLLIESSGHEGQTIVLNLDGDAFGTGVALSFYELDGSGAEVAADIVKASSLADVLDATDDETAEYRVVRDEDGLQVLVSIPHFSAKRLVIQSDEAEEAGPPVMLLLFVLAGLVAAGAVWFSGTKVHAWYGAKKGQRPPAGGA